MATRGKPKRKPAPKTKLEHTTAIILSKTTLAMLDNLRGDQTRAAFITSIVTRAHKRNLEVTTPAPAGASHLMRNADTMERAYGSSR